jgi:hypothetical protein
MDNGVIGKQNKWEDLVGLVSVDGLYRLDIDVKRGCGNIINTKTGKREHYLTTHSFYSSRYKHTEAVLRDYSFDVTLGSTDFLAGFTDDPTNRLMAEMFLHGMELKEAQDEANKNFNIIPEREDWNNRPRFHRDKKRRGKGV